MSSQISRLYRGGINQSQGRKLRALVLNAYASFSEGCQLIWVSAIKESTNRARWPYFEIFEIALGS
jgi:hypothetical protein